MESSLACEVGDNGGRDGCDCVWEVEDERLRVITSGGGEVMSVDLRCSRDRALYVPLRVRGAEPLVRPCACACPSADAPSRLRCDTCVPRARGAAIVGQCSTGLRRTRRARSGEGRSWAGGRFRACSRREHEGAGQESQGAHIQGYHPCARVIHVCS